MKMIFNTQGRYFLFFKFRFQSIAGCFLLSFLLMSSSNAQVSQSPVSKPLLTAQEANVELNYYTLYAEQWEISRSAETVLFLPALNQIVNDWLDRRQMKIEIQYPGGEEGELWVHELTDWLVSLGIPSDYLVVIAGSGADDVINFTLIK